MDYFNNRLILVILLTLCLTSTTIIGEMSIGRNSQRIGGPGSVVANNNNNKSNNQQGMDTSTMAANRSISDMCAKKGRYCEIICKNNPAEGGPLCNCDAYALRSNSATNLANCNHII